MKRNCWLVWMLPQQMSMAYGDWETRSDSFISNSCWPVAWMPGIYICTNAISWSIFHRSSMGKFLTVLSDFSYIYRSELIGFSITCGWKEFLVSAGNMWWKRPAGPEYQIAWWPRVLPSKLEDTWKPLSSSVPNNYGFSQFFFCYVKLFLSVAWGIYSTLY